MAVNIGLPKLPASIYSPMAKYQKYYAKPIGLRKVGDTKFMHNTTYEWTGNYWKCLDPSKRKFTVDRKIKGTEARKKALEEQLDIEPGSGMSTKALTEAVKAGGVEAWQKAKVAAMPIPTTRAQVIVPDVIKEEGEFTVLAGAAIRSETTGKVIGYIGANNQLMDIHGTVIGSYVGDRKDVSSVSLAKFETVPKREGLPECTARNYDKAKEYLIELMEKGEIPGGSTLVQRHNEWVYIPPKPENELYRLDSDEWVYKKDYDKLNTNDKEYLNKHGITQFIEGYIPVQEWLAEATRVQYADAMTDLKPFEVKSEVPAGITTPAFVKYIKSIKGYDVVAAVGEATKDKDNIDKQLIENIRLLFGDKTYAAAKTQCEKEGRQEFATKAAREYAALPMMERVKTSFAKQKDDPFFFMNEIGASMGNIQEFSKQQPTNIITMPYKLAGGLITGAAMILVAPAMLYGIGAQRSGTAQWEATKKVVKGTGTFFASIPIAMKADPFFTTGMIAGMILGPKGLFRVAKTTRVWVDPYGTPARSIGIEFSTARAAISKFNQADLGLAMDLAARQIMEGNLKGTITVKGVKINFRGAPIQQTVGDVLFSGTPDATNFIKPGTVHIKPGGLYTSVSAPQRFMAGGAKGTKIVNPAIIAIMTDAAKIQRVSAKVLGRASQSDWYIRQAQEGFHSVSKTYRHAFESETVGAPKTALAHAPTTLRSRILGTKAGDFFTQYTGPDMVGLPKGKLVPMYFFLDKGVFRVPPSPALMYATKLLTIREALLDYAQALKHPTRTVKDIVSRRIGTKGVRELEVYRVKDIAEWAEKITKEAEKTAKRQSGEAGYIYPEAFRRALVRSFEAERARIYRLASGVLEGAYEANPKRYEEIYRYNLERNLRAATIAYSSARAYEDTRRGAERGLPVVTRYAPPRPTERDFARRGIVEPRTPQVPRREPPRTPTPPRRGEPRAPRITQVRIPPPKVPLPKPRIILLPSGESLRLTKKQWEGIIAWKQGWIYKMIYPPYGVHDIVNSRKPLAGVKYSKGVGSAYKSVIAKGGTVPREVLRDMGIMDLRFRSDRPTTRKPKLFYKRDIKQRTRTTPRISGIRRIK